MWIIHTNDGSELTYPWGSSMYTSSSSNPFRKACIVDVNLLNGPMMSDGNIENNPYSNGFDNRWKGFLKIKPLSLMKSFCNKPSLLLVYIPIRIFLHPKTHLYPIAWLWGGRGTRYQVLLLMRTSYYVCITDFHCKSCKAYLTFLGSELKKQPRIKYWLNES